MNKQEREKLETAFAEQLTLAGIDYTRQEKCIPERRFKADFFLEKTRDFLAVEIDGGVWIGHNKAKFGTGKQSAGGHQSGYGKEGDCERDCIFLMYGIHVLRITEKQIKDGMALEAVKAWLKR